MADSYRLTVLKKLTAHLKTITPQNGYDFDLSNSVFRGRASYGEDNPLPLVSILESTRPDNGSFAGEEQSERKENWSLLIQGWVHDDVENPTDPAYALMDAVERHLFRLIAESSINGAAIYPDEYLLGRSIGGITILPGVVRPPMEQVSSKAFFYLPVRVTLVRNVG